MLRKDAPEGMRCILAAAIGMEHNPRRGFSPSQGLMERLEDQILGESLPHGPADAPAAV